LPEIVRPSRVIIRDPPNRLQAIQARPGRAVDHAPLRSGQALSAGKLKIV